MLIPVPAPFIINCPGTVPLPNVIEPLFLVIIVKGTSETDPSEEIILDPVNPVPNVISPNVVLNNPEETALVPSLFINSVFTALLVIPPPPPVAFIVKLG